MKKKNDMIPLFQSPAVGFKMVTSFSSLLQLLLVALDVSSFPDSVQVKSRGPGESTGPMQAELENGSEMVRSVCM